MTGTPRPLLIAPDPRLAEVATPVDVVDDEIRALLDDMVVTMEVRLGLGLAAPQVGVGKRVIVVRDGLSEPVVELVNPKIVYEESRVVSEEGCLSVPGLVVDVPRARVVDVDALDRDGDEIRVTLVGVAAFVAQHEIDHLDGKTLLDRVSGARRRKWLNRHGGAVGTITYGRHP